MEWAKEQANRGKIREPSVIGAILKLGNCLNLMERESIELLSLGYELLEYKSKMYGIEMPKNKNIKDNHDLLIRERDCAVIQQIHVLTQEKDNNLELFDSVRGLFVEGDEAYPGAGFCAKTHIQICVVNPNCIVGCFLPRKRNRRFELL